MVLQKVQILGLAYLPHAHEHDIVGEAPSLLTRKLDSDAPCPKATLCTLRSMSLAPHTPLPIFKVFILVALAIIVKLAVFVPPAIPECQRLEASLCGAAEYNCQPWLQAN